VTLRQLRRGRDSGSFFPFPPEGRRGRSSTPLPGAKSCKPVGRLSEPGQMLPNL